MDEKKREFVVPSIILNGVEYIIDPDIEATQLILQALTSYDITIDEKEGDEAVGKKLLMLIFNLMKEGKLSEVLSYLFTPKGEQWSVEGAKKWEPEFRKMKPREVLELSPLFFSVLSGKPFDSAV